MVIILKVAIVVATMVHTILKREHISISKRDIDKRFALNNAYITATLVST